MSFGCSSIGSVFSIYTLSWQECKSLDEKIGFVIGKVIKAIGIVFEKGWDLFLSVYSHIKKLSDTIGLSSILSKIKNFVKKIICFVFENIIKLVEKVVLFIFDLFDLVFNKIPYEIPGILKKLFSFTHNKHNSDEKNRIGKLMDKLFSSKHFLKLTNVVKAAKDFIITQIVKPIISFIDNIFKATLYPMTNFLLYKGITPVVEFLFVDIIGNSINSIGRVVHGVLSGMASNNDNSDVQTMELQAEIEHGIVSEIASNNDKADLKTMELQDKHQDKEIKDEDQAYPY